MLEAAGWIIQDMKSLNPGAYPGIAIREYPTDTGPADYALLLDRTPIGIIEVKKEGVALSAFQDQAGRSRMKAWGIWKTCRIRMFLPWKSSRTWRRG